MALTITVAERFQLVGREIDRACADAGRDPAGVRLLPVTKTQPLAVIRQAIDVGWRRFGENRVQELSAKASALLDDPSVEWELIGQLQRNKVAGALERIVRLQSLDSERLAQALESRLAAQPERRLAVLVEVNTSGEATKAGLPPSEVLAFTRALRAYPHLEVEGLMTVADRDPQRAEAGFALMAELQDRLRQRDGGGWAELSMGMSADYQAAIAWGSTCLRLGTALFGPRPT